MIDHKFADDEIIKALKFCAEDKVNCIGCRFYIENDDSASGCRYLTESAIDLINRQKASLQEVITLNSKLEAENAKLQRLLDFYEETSGNKKARAEAIKEFAERLKANMSNIARMEYGGNIYFCVGYDLIDKLVKEMTDKHDT